MGRIVHCFKTYFVWVFFKLNSFSGEVRVPGLQNGGPGWEGGGERSAPAYQPPQPGEQGALPGPQGAAQPPPPGPQTEGGGGQMNKKPTRRPGIKPPPDRAKRSIYLFSLKNPIRQLFIKVNINFKISPKMNYHVCVLDNRSKMVRSSHPFNNSGYLHLTRRIHPFP